MDERGIVQYIKELYPEGCVIQLYVDKLGVRLINTEVATFKEGGQE
jgi:hypothetical protein